MKRTWVPFALLLAAAFTASAQDKLMTVMVEPFANDGEGSFSWLSAGFTDTVISDLGNLRGIRVITEKDRKKALSQIEFSLSGLTPADAQKKLGNMLGADLILTGNYLVVGGAVRVNVRMVNIETGLVEKTLKADGTMGGIFDLQDRIVLGLMENAGTIRLSGVSVPFITEKEKEGIRKTPRTDLSVFELYSKGLEEEERNPVLSLEYYRRAMQADPKYLHAIIRAGYVAGSVFNRFDEALGYLADAEALLQARGAMADQTYAYFVGTLGSVYLDKKENDKALEMYGKSREIYDRLSLQDTDGYASILNNMGSSMPTSARRISLSNTMPGRRTSATGCPCRKRKDTRD